jgi:hypothetical protein
MLFAMNESFENWIEVLVNKRLTGSRTGASSSP